MSTDKRADTVENIAKGLATPALILAVLLGLAYLLGKPHW